MWRISTHALTEGDAFVAAMFSKDEIFQLTPSRRATEQLLAENEQLIISTHALTEGDPLYQDSDENYQAFQLTPSRRATDELNMVDEVKGISTHALTEGDLSAVCTVNQIQYFNSRPHGGRRHASAHGAPPAQFQLTPSRRATRAGQSWKTVCSFQLTPSRRATAGLKCDLR